MANVGNKIDAYQKFDSMGTLYPRSNLGWYIRKMIVDAN
jgi:hypothetical protein